MILLMTDCHVVPILTLEIVSMMKLLVAKRDCPTQSLPSTGCVSDKLSTGEQLVFAEWHRCLATALLDDDDVMESGEEHTSKPEGCYTPNRFLALPNLSF